MKRFEMVKLLTEGSPFDLRDEKTYKMLLGAETEIRPWCKDSEIWYEIHDVLKKPKKLSVWMVGSLDFRPVFSLTKEATRIVWEAFTKNVEDLSKEQLEMLFATLMVNEPMGKYISLMVGPGEVLEQSELRKVLKWLEEHAFCLERMTEQEKLNWMALLGEQDK